MQKVIVFIDGFNLYHAIASNSQYRKYKWINLYKLANLYLTHSEILKAVYYFTAFANWSQNKVKKHRIFIRVQELNNVQIIFGKFRLVDKKCRNCHRFYKTYEEKQTDVNIAVNLFKLSMEDMYDKAIIISGDSDLLPSIKAVKKSFPSKQIGIVIPIGRRAEELKNECDFHMKMKEKHLQSSILDREIHFPDGSSVVCPQDWI